MVGTVSGSPSGGHIRHWPPVPAREYFFIFKCPFFLINVRLPIRNETNLYPLSSPPTRCPASCAIISTISETTKAQMPTSPAIIPTRKEAELSLSRYSAKVVSVNIISPAPARTRPIAPPISRPPNNLSIVFRNPIGINNVTV